MISKQIGVRLSLDELHALRNLPGSNDAERVRNLIRNAGITESLVATITRTVAQRTAEQIDAAASRISHDNRTALAELMKQLNRVLMQHEN